MFGLTAAVRVYLATQPADMRKSFDGLAALTTHALGLDPLSGHLFVFANRRRDRIKILYSILLGPRRPRHRGEAA